MDHVKKLLPVLGSHLWKGNCGKIAVIGGSVEYTGAPCFAAISILKLGADLVHVFCAPEAASVIKTFSPDFIVHPGLDPDTVVNKLMHMDAIVLGPGLGRDPSVLPLVLRVIHFVKKTQLPFVIDADGLWFLHEAISSIPALPSAILTPNKIEFSRLCQAALNVKDVLSIKDDEQLKKLALELSTKIGISLFIKGHHDIIINPMEGVSIGDENGSPRRCGGQGDACSGSLALFLLWASRMTSLPEAKLEAGLASSQLIRCAAARAFLSEGRSMVTSDIIAQFSLILKEIDAIKP